MSKPSTIALIAVALAAAAFASSCSASTQTAPAPAFAGVRVDDLTSAERADLDRYLHVFPSPCKDITVPLGECIDRNLACKACRPAAEFVADAIRSGRSRDQIKAAYLARFDPGLVRSIDTTGAPFVGPANAPVTIVEFADFQCPSCALSVDILDRLVSGYTPHVRLCFKHYPLQYHTQADYASRAAVAAMRQNKFWELHHLMFRNRTALQPEDIDRYAASLNLDMARFKTDVLSPEVKQYVDRDRSQGDELHLRGTPSVFINGREFSFELFDFGGDDLLDWIELEIELATGRKPPRPPAPSNSTPKVTQQGAGE